MEKHTECSMTGKEEKQILRKKLQRLRGEMSEQEIQRKSRDICERVRALPAFMDSHIPLLAYSPIRQEVNITPLLLEALDMGKPLYLPRVCKKEMEFFRVRTLSELVPGVFQILEPLPKEPFRENQALILMPGLAFDHFGGRIGYGGGYYDRYVSALRRKNHTVGEHDQKLLQTGQEMRDFFYLTVAVCYESQLVAHVPMEPTDQRVQYVITEKSMYMQDIT